MSEASTQFAKTRHRAYGEPKAKRHLYLTDTAYQHLVDSATSADSSPSEVCEQIVRNHIHALAIPADDVFQLPVSAPSTETSPS